MTLWGLACEFALDQTAQVVECFEDALAHCFNGECFGVGTFGGFRCDLGVVRQGQDTMVSWRNLRARLVGADFDPGKGCTRPKGRSGR